MRGSFTTTNFKTMKFTAILPFFALVGLTIAADEPAIKPVKISLYYESLCPDSRAFVLTQLAPTYEKLGAHLTLDLVPFGNVNVTLNGTNSTVPRFSCQHGPNECYGNLVEACVIRHQPQAAALSFVQCMFLGVHRSVDAWKDTHFNAQACANLLFLNWNDELKKCIEGPEGEKLIEANWKKTEALKPKHTGVPWILVNDQVHTAEVQRQAQFSLKDYLCKTHFSKANLLGCLV